MAETHLSRWSVAVVQNIAGSVIWAIILALGSGLAVLLAKMTPVVAKFAPLSYFFIFFAALIVLLAVANLGIVLLHRFRPPLRPVPRPTEDASNLVTEGDLARDELKKIESETTKAHARIGLLERELSAQKANMDHNYSAQDGARMQGLNALKQEIEAIRQGAANLDERERANRNQTLEALHTVWLRERMATEGATIRRTAAELYEPLRNGEIYNKKRWEEWRRIQSEWESTLNAWLSTATFFGVAIIERTTTFDDSRYGGKWSVTRDQFLDDEDMRIFKKFRIIQQQWEAIVPEIEMGMHKVAFGGLTQEEVRRGGRPG